MARRAASIWRAVIHAGSTVISAYSPNAIVLPPLARPDMRPRWTRRCLTRRGRSMLLRSRSARGGGGLRRRLALGHHVAAVDPDLDADAAVRRVCVDLPV